MEIGHIIGSVITRVKPQSDNQPGYKEKTIYKNRGRGMKKLIKATVLAILFTSNAFAGWQCQITTTTWDSDGNIIKSLSSQSEWFDTSRDYSMSSHIHNYDDSGSSTDVECRWRPDKKLYR